MNDTTEAPQAQKSAQERYDEARNHHDAIKTEMNRRIRDATDAIMLEFESALVDAGSRVSEAKREVDEESVTKLADQGPAVGSRYVERKPRVWWSSSSSEYQLTGRAAVVEQRTPVTEFAVNVGRSSLPPVGEKFLRIVKKDGTPGLQFARLGGRHWIPEGSEKE